MIGRADGLTLRKAYDWSNRWDVRTWKVKLNERGFSLICPQSVQVRPLSRPSGFTRTLECVSPLFLFCFEVLYEAVQGYQGVARVFVVVFVNGVEVQYKLKDMALRAFIV